MNPYYFGPKQADGTVSPYWPEINTWNLHDISQRMIQPLMIKLKTFSESSLLRGIPLNLHCACKGKYCLVPVLTQLCINMSIPRISNNFFPDLSKVILTPLLLFIPLFNVTEKDRFIAKLGYDLLTYIHAVIIYKYGNVEEVSKDIKKRWEIDDIKTLCYAITLPDSPKWDELIHEAENLQIEK